jgi:hypothetical protein
VFDEGIIATMEYDLNERVFLSRDVECPTKIREKSES